MRTVLASASPRRRELLEKFALPGFCVFPAKGGEDGCEDLSPEDTVIALSLNKAREVAQSFGADDVIIAADTIVFACGEKLGKPRDEADAERMLRLLSGAKHTVFTGVTVLRGELELTAAEATDVFFRELEAREIAAYIRSGEPMDKAGAYGIQGLASAFVERVEGDYFNVMGLPVCRLGAMLTQAGVVLI